MKAWMTAALALALGVGVAPARAQDASTRSAPRATTRVLDTVLARMTRDLGATVLADSSLAGLQAPLPSAPTSADNIDDQLDALVKALPPGTVWAKVLLPAPKGRSYRPDDLVDYVLAQARLFGGAGASHKGQVEVLGKRLDASAAEPVVSALNLKPYYLIANLAARAARNSDVAKMAPDQQLDAMVQGFKGLMNLDPQNRTAVLKQMMQTFGDAVRGMTPEQRADFFSSMRGAGAGSGQVIIFGGDGRR